MKVLVVYYSLYGHIHRMAAAIAEGARSVEGTEVDLRRVPETLPADVLGKMGAVEAQKQMADIPVCTVDELAGADAIVVGTPTRIGNKGGQMRQVLDSTGPLGFHGYHVGQVGSVVTSANTQNRGLESTQRTLQT
jgi:NAD(P)H dehydrogenase (quinone)